ncbi:winged helix-turn-helix domain-containing protein [Streptomyces fradiae]|uniref:winged helix-turn-helix domain-containing protein n=1 Tax=Streptomyces fradiae TaxID=1906 RepID=UPI003802974B
MHLRDDDGGVRDPVAAHAHAHAALRPAARVPAPGASLTGPPEIRSGRIPPGGALSGITRLAEAYGVADRTVRRALRDLRERGLIETLPHKGSYVVDVLPPAEGSGGGTADGA